MNMVTVGIDLAKNIFALHGVDQSGKKGKNDAQDAAAICEAVSRPNMRFVPIKDIDQQSHLCPHRTRQGFVEEQLAQRAGKMGMKLVAGENPA